jgi:dethiobiotin synthetase
MKNYFITGTDTNVGKTLVSSILTLALSACYWKPIQSGCPDRERVRELTGVPEDRIFPTHYLFKAPLSPDQAARLEDKVIDLKHCEFPRTSYPVIVEGAGGVCVPLNADQLMLDLMKKLNLPIVLVSRGTVGTINHTLLTIEAIRQRNLTIHGIVFSGELNRDNQMAIEKWGKTRTLFHVPFIENMNAENLQHWVKENKNIILEEFI